jgi:hypothetical protein
MREETWVRVYKEVLMEVEHAKTRALAPEMPVPRYCLRSERLSARSRYVVVIVTFGIMLTAALVSLSVFGAVQEEALPLQ